MNWNTVAAESGSERLCCNQMRQSLYLHWCPNFGKLVERNCAELTLSSLATQTILLDVHERLERARDRFAQAAKEPGVEEPQRKRHRPEGEGEEPLALVDRTHLTRDFFMILTCTFRGSRA